VARDKGGMPEKNTSLHEAAERGGLSPTDLG